MDKIILNNEISQKLYKESMDTLVDKDKVEEVLDELLIDSILSRKVALHIESTKSNTILDNEFTVVEVNCNNVIKRVSVGRLKKTKDCDSKLVYGMLY